MGTFEYDVFISHATEDKARFARPLARRLKRWGLNVWFDEFTLKVGDSVRESIERGLSRSRYGVVIFSKSFFAKKWTKAELSGLFSREMDGQKVILPVWYKITSADMKAADLAIQVDKKALRSKAGIESIARSLVEVIRPDLLELEARQTSAFEAGESFIEEARKNFPGYDFTVYSGATEAPSGPGSVFSTSRGNRRIDIRVSDASKLEGLPGGKVTFFGDGVKKAFEFQRTGRPQTWKTGEFKLEGWNIPLMPSEISNGLLLGTEQSLSSFPPRHMRVEIGSPPVATFPMLTMRLVRRGTHEAEAVMSDEEVPLKINLAFPLGDKPDELTFTISWETAGQKVSELQKLIDAIDGFRDGKKLRFIDIRLDKAVMETTAVTEMQADPFSKGFRHTISLANQIEKEFGVTLRMPQVMSDEDGESLFHLDCLLNGREYGTPGNTTFRFVKADGDLGAAQESVLLTESTLTLTQEPIDFPGYFPLFGQRIVTPQWVRNMTFIVVKESVDIESFRNAPIGTPIQMEITANGEGYLNWKRS
jgi:hypothetical protein